MPTLADTFDPLATGSMPAVLGDLDALLDLYDERATLECDCERVGLAGRESIAACGHQNWSEG